MLSLLPFAAGALNLGLVAPSYDGVYYATLYPAGDKPQPACDPPAGYTEANKQDGGGEICGVSASNFTFNTSGTGPRAKFHYVYKDGGASDIQMIWRNAGSYTGNLTANTAFGGGITAGTADDDFWHENAAAYTGSPVVRFTSGTSGSDIVIADGDALETLPEYFCVTYDASAGESRGFNSEDGSTWVEVNAVSHTFADPQVFFFGSSGSTSATAQASFDNIDVDLGASAISCYTPDPPPPGAPVLESDILNQSAQVSIAFTLDVSANFSGETPLTHPYTATWSTSVSGGLSFNGTTGVMSGTPDADDLAASPISVNFCAVNVTGSACDTSLITVAAAPGGGDILTLPTDGSLVDCDTFESGGAVDPGDILQFNGVNHDPLKIQDCHGSVELPIIIRNDPNDAAPATITRASDGKSYVLEISDSDNWKLTGVAYSGVPAGTLGVTVSGGVHTENTTSHGILITKAAAPQSQPTAFLRVSGTSCTPNCEVSGVKINALTNTLGTGICFSLNDHTATYTEPATPIFREGIYWHNNVGLFCGAEGEGFYVGPNQSGTTTHDYPLKDVRIENNLVQDSGRDAFNIKSVFGGTNTYLNNHMLRTGLTQGGTQNQGLNLQLNADATISGNRIRDTGGYGLVVNWQADDAQGSNGRTLLIENNMISGAGQNNVNGKGDGIHLTRNSQAPTVTTTIRSNTIADSDENAMDCAGSINPSAYNNIMAGSGSTANSGCGGDASNKTGTTASFNFVNAASDDYHLQVTSTTACQLATAGNSPDTDYDGQSRPLDGADDVGADEAAACQ